MYLKMLFGFTFLNIFVLANTVKAAFDENIPFLLKCCEILLQMPTFLVLVSIIIVFTGIS